MIQSLDAVLDRMASRAYAFFGRWLIERNVFDEGDFVYVRTVTMPRLRRRMRSSSARHHFLTETTTP